MASNQSNTRSSSKVAVGTKGASGAGSITTGPVTVVQTKPAKGFRLQLQQMLTGLQTALPSDGSLVAPGGSNTGSLSASTMIQQMQAGLADYSAVDTAELAQETARATLNQDLPSLRLQYAAIKQALVYFFGSSNPELAQFGVKPKGKPATPSPATLVAAAAKREQTRAIRHTEGPKQKAAVKFTGQVAVSTEVNAPSATSTASSPVVPGPASSTAGSTPGAA